MTTSGKPDKQRLIFGLFLIVFIIIGELTLHYFHLPAWPAFMCMIFFFLSHMDTKLIPNIIVGGIFGIVCLIADFMFIKAIAPIIGVEPAKLIFIAILVFLIVAFGEMLPIIFNNYAFTFFIFAGLSSKLPDTNMYVLMGVTLIGGSVMIAGVLGIIKLMGLLMEKKEEAEQTS